MNLVTIEQVRAHCRAEAEDDAILTIYADAAEEAAQNFLNRRVYATPEAMAAAILDDTAGCDPMVVTPAVTAAVLLATGHMYRNRESVTDAPARNLPQGFHDLLWPHRVGLGV